MLRDLPTSQRSYQTPLLVNFSLRARAVAARGFTKASRYRCEGSEISPSKLLHSPAFTRRRMHLEETVYWHTLQFKSFDFGYTCRWDKYLKEGSACIYGPFHNTNSVYRFTFFIPYPGRPTPELLPVIDACPRSNAISATVSTQAGSGLIGQFTHHRICHKFNNNRTWTVFVLTTDCITQKVVFNSSLWCYKVLPIYIYTVCMYVLSTVFSLF